MLSCFFKGQNFYFPFVWSLKLGIQNDYIMVIMLMLFFSIVKSNKQSGEK